MKARELVASLYRQNLASFIPFAFRQTHPGVGFLDNWHIEVVADALDKVWRGEINRLIINLPPRSLKSFCVSVAFVAWIMAKAPNREILHIVGNRDLKKDLEDACRALLLSPKMRALFPPLRLLKAAKGIVLAQGGSRRSAMTYENLTGKGADMIILDDPMDAGKADDPKEIARLAKWVQSTIVQRLNRTEDPVILVMQRLHDEDLTRHLLESGDKWTLLNIPAIATRDETWILSDGRVLTRKRREPLHAARQSIDDLLEVAQTIGGLNFWAQYQQSPIGKIAAQQRSTVWVPANKNPNKPCGLYRVDELDRVKVDVFCIGEAWYSVAPHEHQSWEEIEAEAVAEQAKLVASMRADFL